MTTADRAAHLVSLLGGTGNLAAVTHCAVRLRITLHDPARADVAAVEALGWVGMVVGRPPQLHVVPRTDLVGLHAEVQALLA